MNALSFIEHVSVIRLMMWVKLSPGFIFRGPFTEGSIGEQG